MQQIRRNLLRAAVCRSAALRMAGRPGMQVRHLNVHEHSAFQIMKGYGVQLPKGVVAVTPKEAFDAFSSEELKDKTDVVIKAQALTGRFQDGWRFWRMITIIRFMVIFVQVAEEGVALRTGSKEECM